MNLRRRHFRSAAVLLAALILLGCSRTPPSRLPLTTMQIGPKQFNLEVATSSADQEVGLMYRDRMDRDHGMIFIFTDDQTMPFWNKNVHFPLDLIFTDASGTVVSIKYMPPFDEHNFYSDAPYRYAIELNGGEAKELGISNGSHLKIPETGKAQ